MAASGDLPEPDTYLTNGEELFRVIRCWAPSGQVMLEDAGRPELAPVVCSVAQLAQDGLRVVKRRNLRT